jgi:hypothetical protein
MEEGREKCNIFSISVDVNCCPLVVALLLLCGAENIVCKASLNTVRTKTSASQALWCFHR